MDLLSIVTPCLNASEFIEATARSVLGQSYPRVEYIVVDGGSTDGTPEILGQFRTQLRLISAPGLRQAAAINLGWAQAQGEILAWLNADDVYLPDALEAVASWFAGTQDLDVAYGDASYLDDRGRVLGAYRTRPFDYNALLEGAVNFVPQPATFLRRRVVESHGFLREDLDYLMDFEYWLRVGRTTRIEYRPGILAGMRLHAGAKSVSARQHFGAEIVRIYQGLPWAAGLPPDVARHSGRALAKASYLAADACFWAGALPEARRYVLASWRLSPLQPPRGLFRLTALTLAGGLGRRLALWMYGDPYRPGLVEGRS